MSEEIFEDELTEQMIAAVKALKESHEKTIGELRRSHLSEMAAKERTISELSSQISILKSELQKLADKIETQNNADLLKKENEQLKRENERIKNDNDRITKKNEELFLLVDKTAKLYDGVRPLVRAIEASNEAVEVKLSEETEKAAVRIVEPIKKHLEEANEEARANLYITAFNKWTAAGLCIIFIASAVFAGYKLKDTREALGRVGTKINQIYEFEKNRYGGQ